MITADEIMQIIQTIIRKWHMDEEVRPDGYVIVDDNMRKIRGLGVHRDDVQKVIEELVYTNTEMWHEEDKVRSENDQVVLKAIRNINPLNQHRNDLIEEIDEIFLERCAGADSLLPQPGGR